MFTMMIPLLNSQPNYYDLFYTIIMIHIFNNKFINNNAYIFLFIIDIINDIPYIHIYIYIYILLLSDLGLHQGFCRS